MDVSKKLNNIKQLYNSPSYTNVLKCWSETNDATIKKFVEKIKQDTNDIITHVEKYKKQKNRQDLIIVLEKLMSLSKITTNAKWIKFIHQNCTDDLIKFEQHRVKLSQNDMNDVLKILKQLMKK